MLKACSLYSEEFHGSERRGISLAPEVIPVPIRRTRPAVPFGILPTASAAIITAPSACDILQPATSPDGY
jgi:hypothetical protein